MSSILITLEGNSLTGKSTAIVSLEKLLVKNGSKVITSREPGGTPTAEILRREIAELRKRTDIEADEKMILILTKIYEARNSHLQEKIIPHLGQSKDKETVMLLDRFEDTTFVYQYLEGGADFDMLMGLHDQVVGNFWPDLTYIFYFPEEILAKTLWQRQHTTESNPGTRDQNIGDKSPVAEYLARQNLYLSLPQLFDELGISRNFALIDASQTPETIFQNMIVELILFIEKHQEFRLSIDLAALKEFAAEYIETQERLFNKLS